MKTLHELNEHRRPARLERWLRRSDPTLVAGFHRSLRARRRLFAGHRWTRIGLASFASCWFAGLGVALGMRVDVSLGIVVAAVPVLT